jgi:hypothetical protein
MISWLTWPVEVLAQLFISDRTAQIQKKIEEKLGDARYLTVDDWAEIHGVPAEKAEQQLEAAVKAGALEKMYLHRGPIDFVVPANRLETDVRPEELGVAGEDEDPIFVSKFKTEPVYVAPGEVGHTTRHAA